MSSIRRRRVDAFRRVIIQFLHHRLVSDSMERVKEKRIDLEVGVHDNLLLVRILERFTPLDRPRQRLHEIVDLVSIVG